MLVVETVARVRRAYFVQEKSIKEIARDMKVSRKTVRKVIRREQPPSITPAGHSLLRSSGPGVTRLMACC